MILNLTQHLATPEQVAAGVVDLPAELRSLAITAMTAYSLPATEDITTMAEQIAAIAAAAASPEDRSDNNILPAGDNGGFADSAMIGGAPWLMAALESALQAQGIEPVYAFSRRESVEETQPDGSVRKTQIFRHLGFVRSCALR